MESQKIINLIEPDDHNNELGFQTRKWYTINDQIIVNIKKIVQLNLIRK